jgi:hypothetical protein
MSMYISRTWIIPVWVAVFGLLAAFGSPITASMGVLLLIAGIVIPSIMLILWQEPTPTVAQVLHWVEPSRTDQ